MIIYRVCYVVKHGQRDAVVKFLKETQSMSDNPNRMRILTPIIGPQSNMVVFEFTDQDVLENVKFWVAWLDHPENNATLERINQMVEYSTNEYWDIVE